MRIPGAIIVGVLTLLGTAEGDEPAGAKYVGTPDENELIGMIEALQDRYVAMGPDLEKISDASERYKYFEEHDPAKEFAPKLLAFEQRHAGTDLGLMALRKLDLQAASAGVPNSPSEQARREGFRRLLKYAKSPLLPEILRYMSSGTYEPATDEFLRMLAADPQADPMVREFSRLMRAECLLAAVNYRQTTDQRRRERTSGSAEWFAGEKKFREEEQMRLPELEQVRTWEREATELLRSVETSGQEYRQPAVKGIDPNWRLIRFDAERTKTMPLLSDMAAGLLFARSHLKLEKPAPDLKVTLLTGKEWDLREQRGKVAVIQFSFKGCGPCEAMYPELRELQAAHTDRVAILSVMADENKIDTDEAVAEGKLTWNVYWDGFRGPVATRWAVRGFPTVYVIDRQGQIAATNRRDLTEKVRELLR